MTLDVVSAVGERISGSINLGSENSSITRVIERTNDCRVIVFAKAPIAGFAKTRLARVIGNEAAAKLASRMLSETLKQAVQAGVGPVELCCAPDTTHPQFSEEQARHGVVVTSQGEGDLGKRMCRAFDRALIQHQRVLIIGTDAPDLKARQLQQAATALQTYGAAFAPAHDGGYVMIGLSRAMPSVFDGVAWSTADVMAQTRKNLAAIDESFFELAPCFDVDEVEDLKHVPMEWLAV